MNVAIIDIGSNNIKLEIFDVDTLGSGRLLYSEKIPARLGHNAFITQKLHPENLELAVNGLTQLSRIVKSHNCKTVIALGTAALRETECSDFIKRVYKESGIQISVISGLEEARLVYYGVLAHHQFSGRTFFLNDIGGGSTEISVSDDKNMYFVESLRLGTVRLKEMFQSSNEKDAFEMMQRYVEKVFQPYLSEIKNYKIDMGLSTGGTARNLAEMAAARFNKKEEDSGMLVLYTSDLCALISELQEMTPKEREKTAGLDPARSDIILPGGILLLTLLETAKIEKSLVSNRGLRDGALYDYIFRKVNKKIFGERQDTIRIHGLRSVSEKYNVDKVHAAHCAELALQLFDLLIDIHDVPEEMRDILYGAALLHDAGRMIDYSQHHKHSFYLIQNTHLLGFTQHERLLIALTARYHRKGMPKSSHSEYQSLNQQDQSHVVKLAALLRMADSLDRSYQSSVKQIELLDSGKDKLQLGIRKRGDISLELWTFDRKKEFAEKIFGRSIELKVI
ncbi:MAG: Ppx/GppA family phosphatase [Leptospiraceae bacterium]|nr:Ppx/GppA family phosphatase [Leptospiraceae bacterium]